jgi:dTDP-4-amino-4,6-dideoxygalactose transaminase
MDADLLAEAFERFAPKAVMLVHLYGWGSAQLERIRALCRDAGVHLIEDGAQAFGVTWNGKSIYGDAEVSSISFYPAKVVGACGDAGALVCRDPDLGDSLRRLGNHGRTGHYEHGFVGWNSRMGGFDAAFLDLSLDRLETRLACRRRLAAQYRDRLGAIGITTVGPPAGYEENGYLNVCLIEPDQRPRVEAALRNRGIGFGNVYPGAMSAQPAAAPHLAGQLGGAHARKLASSLLNLPLFAGMTDAELDEVIEAMTATGA